MRQDDGPIHVVKAPHFYVAPPGRKMGLAIFDTVWVNIFATEETDVEKLEARLFQDSQAFLTLAEKIQLEREASHALDREDFQFVLDEFGIAFEEARKLSEDESDLVPMPEGWPIMIRPSAIEGKGVFIQTRARPGEVIAPTRINGKRTPVGRYANHSRRPNAKFVERAGDSYLMAIEIIAPFCSEVVPGDEVVVDYRSVLALVGRLR
jgi:hypothetical protein